MTRTATDFAARAGDPMPFAEPITSRVGAVLELPYPCERDAKRALLRGAYRISALALRRETGHIGAAIALEQLADALRSYPIADDDEPTVVVHMVVP